MNIRPSNDNVVSEWTWRGLPGIFGIPGEGLFISGSWGALVITCSLKELGSKLIAFGDLDS